MSAVVSLRRDTHCEAATWSATTTAPFTA